MNRKCTPLPLKLGQEVRVSASEGQLVVDRKPRGFIPYRLALSFQEGHNHQASKKGSGWNMDGYYLKWERRMNRNR